MFWNHNSNVSFTQRLLEGVLGGICEQQLIVIFDYLLRLERKYLLQYMSQYLVHYSVIN